MPDDRVTLKDVYNAVNRLEDKMDKRLMSVEGDVDDLKSFKSRSLGIVSAIAFAVSFLGDYIKDVLLGRR